MAEPARPWEWWNPNPKEYPEHYPLMVDGPAKLASDDDLKRDRDGQGFTNVYLHRRIDEDLGELETYIGELSTNQLFQTEGEASSALGVSLEDIEKSITNEEIVGDGYLFVKIDEVQKKHFELSLQDLHSYRTTTSYFRNEDDDSVDIIP